MSQKVPCLYILAKFKPSWSRIPIWGSLMQSCDTLVTSHRHMCDMSNVVFWRFCIQQKKRLLLCDSPVTPLWHAPKVTCHRHVTKIDFYQIDPQSPENVSGHVAHRSQKCHRSVTKITLAKFWRWIFIEKFGIPLIISPMGNFVKLVVTATIKTTGLSSSQPPNLLTTTTITSQQASHHSKKTTDSTCLTAEYPHLNNVCQQLKNASRSSVKYRKNRRNASNKHRKQWSVTSINMSGLTRIGT